MPQQSRFKKTHALFLLCFSSSAVQEARTRKKEPSNKTKHIYTQHNETAKEQNLCPLCLLPKGAASTQTSPFVPQSALVNHLHCVPLSPVLYLVVKKA